MKMISDEIPDKVQRNDLSGWETVFFWIFAISMILAGLLTVMARNAVHSALSLFLRWYRVAALFILLGAEFIAACRFWFTWAGVMVLFLFVIMLVNVGARRGRTRPDVSSSFAGWDGAGVLADACARLLYAINARLKAKGQGASSTSNDCEGCPRFRPCRRCDWC